MVLPLQRSWSVAILQDGQSTEAKLQLDRIRKEILSLAGARYEVRFPKELIFDAGWNLERARTELDRLQREPAVDAVLVLGEASLTAASLASERLEKPVFGSTLTHAALLDSLPAASIAGSKASVEEGVATSQPQRPRRFLPAIATLTATDVADLLFRLNASKPTRRWHVLADYPDAPSLRAWCTQLSSALRDRGAATAPVLPLAYAASAEATLATLPSDAEFLLCLPTLRLDASGRTLLYAGLAARRIASFGFAGQRDVEEGALAGNLPDADQILARSIAVRFDSVASGNASDVPFPAAVPLQSRLFLNEATARAIGFPLRYDDLRTATRIGSQETAESGAPLSLPQAVLQALEASFSLKIRAEGSVQARESQRMAASALGPRLGASFRHQQVDRDRAEFAGVVLPETNVRAGLALEQPLLDDASLARHRAAREAYRAASELEKSARLEVAERAFLAYFDALSARALLRLAEENLAITEQNLVLARLRGDAGTAGPEETLRFESAAARQRADVAAAQARLSRALVALNRACNYKPDTPWRLEEVGAESPAFAFSMRAIAPRLRGREETERFLAWASTRALAHSPDLAALERQIEAQRIVVRQQARRPYVPRVALAASLERVVDMELGGPTLLEQLVRRGFLPMPAHLPDRTEWGVALSAQLPLFTSGALSAELRRSRSELRQLEFSEADAREAIVSRARAAFLSLTGSHPNIELSALAAAHAGKNLELTRAKYEQGTVSVITLLDAQVNAQVAREGAALAQYRFLADLVVFHRSLGWHELLSTAEERDALARDIEQALRPSP